MMKTGDLTPAWQIAIASLDPNTDLNDVVSWRFEVSLNRETLFVDPSPAVSVGPNQYEAVVGHTWVAGETDTAGTLKAEIIAVWPGNKEQTFPSKGRAKLTLYDGIE